MKNTFAIIEIGSNNTKTHIYEEGKVVYENNTTIEFKKNYQLENKIMERDFNCLLDVIRKAFAFTSNVHVYGCSIFRKLSDKELEEMNNQLMKEFSLEIEVVSQTDEALYTALGCYSNIDYDGSVCVFIGGGGSIELVFVKNKEVVDKKYYNFGVVDVTKKFPGLKEDIPDCTFEEVYQYIGTLINDLSIEAEVLILGGGDHLYWYNNAEYDLLENSLYSSENQPCMLTKEMSDQYDQDALVTSLDRIRENSDNPLWFDGSRAMKVITNFISHQIHAKYIIPTKINMEDGLKDKLMSEMEK